MPVIETSLDAAEQRLAAALDGLEQRLATAGPRSEAADDLFADDRAELADALGRERARVRELEAVAAEASTALGRAAVEIRAAVSEDA
jgi:hypothetical protein